MTGQVLMVTHLKYSLPFSATFLIGRFALSYILASKSITVLKILCTHNYQFFYFTLLKKIKAAKI